MSAKNTETVRPFQGTLHKLLWRGALAKSRAFRHREEVSSPHDWYQQLKTCLLPPEEPETPKDCKILSSVLVPMGWNRTQNRHEIVLTKRPMTVATHKGEVCFPGGVREKADENFLKTALRELDEEIGIKSDDIEVIGTLPPVRTRGDVWILPWVAQLSLPYPFQVNAKEVEKVLSLPVSQLLEVGLETVNVTVGNANIQSPGLWVENELVWGATARMLVELRAALFEAFVAHKAGGQSN